MIRNSTQSAAALRYAAARDRHSAQPVRRAKFTGATSNTVGVFGTAYESKTVEHLVSRTVTGSVSVSQVLAWFATQAWREGTLKLAVRSRQSLRWLLPYHPTMEAWQARGTKTETAPWSPTPQGNLKPILFPLRASRRPSSVNAASRSSGLPPTP